MATTSMQAHAEVLLDRSSHWSRGYRQSDGLQFVLFTGSTGQTYLSSESGCTCRGYLYRGQCAHVEAIRMEADKARAAAVRRPRYEDVFGADDGLTDAF